VSYQAIFSSAALKETEDSFQWYEDRLPGLGERFIGSLDKSISQLLNSPESYPVKKGKYREISLSKFPYLIIYEVVKKQRAIFILHIFHMRRNPRLKYKK